MALKSSSVCAGGSDRPDRLDPPPTTSPAVVPGSADVPAAAAGAGQTASQPQDSVAGFDLDGGHRCSRMAFGWATRTFVERRERPGEVALTGTGAFSNVLIFGETRLGITSDGIGSKIEVAERMRRYDTLGHDLMAMVVDDLVALGIEPTNVSNILDVDRLDERVVDELMRGLHDAARAARVAVTGGEIAELGSRIGGFGDGMHFNWCATAVGVLPRGRRPLTGEEIAPGDSIIALYSPGFRSNGFTVARRILESRLGPRWHERPAAGTDDSGKRRSWGEVMLTPSVIYAPLIIDFLATGLPVHGLAHITGGGVPDNLGRILRVGSNGAILDNLFPVEPAVLQLQEWGGISDRDAYRTWNMNQGMLVIVPPAVEPNALAWFDRRGVTARVAGHVVFGPGQVLHSRGREGGLLEYLHTGK